MLFRSVATWRAYARLYTSQKTTPHLYNRVGFVDMHGLTARTQDDLRIAQNWQPGSIPQDTPRAIRKGLKLSGRQFRKAKRAKATFSQPTTNE